MSKRKVLTRKNGKPTRSRKHITAVGISVVIVVSVAVSILAQWRPQYLKANHKASLIAQPVPSPTVRAYPTKEYIYAGGRLVATDGPPIQPTGLGDAASFVSQQVPNSMLTGHTYNVSITISNTSNNVWDPSSYSLASLGGSLWDVASVPLQQVVFFNNSVTFSFAITAPSNPGTYNFQWQMSHDGTLFNSPSDNVAVVVKSNQSISFPSISNKTYGDAPFNLNATASSGLTVNYTVLSGLATVSNSTLTLTGAGTVTIQADQAGNNSFNSAPSVTQSFTVAKATPTINWSNPVDINYGTALSSTQLNASALLNGASVAGSYAYNPATGTVLSPGNNQSLSVSFTPTDTNNFNGTSSGAHINVLPVSANSLSANGTTAYMQVPNSASINLTGVFTAEAWVKTTSSTAEYQSVFERFGNPDANGNNGGFILRLHNRKLDFYVLHSSQSGLHLEGNTTLTTNVWHHIAAVCNGSEMRVYLDGVRDGFVSAPQYLPAIGTSPLFIGRGAGGSYGYFGGLIDEARLTASELYTSNFTPQAQLTSSANTRGLWKFDGASSNDFSGNSNTGTPTGSPTFSTDVATLNNHSASFNGSTAQVRVPHATSLEVTGPFTVETWFKTSRIDTNQFLVSALTSTGGFILMNNAGAPQLYIFDGAGHTDFAMPWPANVTTDVWHHMAGVFDGTQIRVYLDGTLCATKNTTVAPGPFTGDLTISGFQDGVNGMVYGLVDEVRLSGGALYTGSSFTPERHLMAATSTKGLWKFDGQTVQDASGNGNHGAFSGGTGYSTDVP